MRKNPAVAISFGAMVVFLLSLPHASSQYFREKAAQSESNIAITPDLHQAPPHPLNVITKLPEKMRSPGMDPRLIRPPFSDESRTSAKNEAAGAADLTVKLWLSFQNDRGTWLPVRFATVELWDKDELTPDDLLASGLTDANGYIAFTVDSADPEFGSGYQDIYFRIWCANGVADVTNAGFTYISQSPVYWNQSPGTYDYNLGVAPEQNGAFNVLDAITKGWQYVTMLTSNPPPVRVIWPHNLPKAASFYDDVSKTIFLAASREWIETSILHEYGHFIMDMYADSNPPFTIYGTDLVHQWGSHETRETAWVEGWADFFQCAVRDFWGPFSDNWGNVTDVGSSSIEASAPWPGQNNMDDVEGAAAAILWDIYDSNNDAGDTLSTGIGKIWDVFQNYDPYTGDPIHNHVWTIHEFWDGWFSRGHGHVPEMWAIFNEHGVRKEDTTPPTNPTSVTSDHSVGVWSRNRSIQIAWSGATDNLSGVHEYAFALDFSPSTLPGTSGNLLTVSQLLLTLNNSSNGYYFHIRTQDNAGNWTPDAVHSGPYTIDDAPPTTGVMLINGGAAYTRNVSVTLSLSSVDPHSGLCQMRIQNDGAPSIFYEPYSASKAWVLRTQILGEAGTKTVSAYFKDCAGNESAGVSASIILDPVSPDTAIVSGPAGTIATNAAAFSYSGSDNLTPAGSLAYAVYLQGYDSGWSAFSTSTTRLYSFLPNGSYTFQVKTKDLAGNEDPTPAARSFTIAGTNLRKTFLPVILRANP